MIGSYLMITVLSLLACGTKGSF